MTPRTRRLSVSVKGEQRIASIKLALFKQHLPLHCKNVAEVNYGAMIAKRFCNSFVDRRRLLFICISSWPTSLTWQATASDVGMCCSQSIAHWFELSERRSGRDHRFIWSSVHTIIIHWSSSSCAATFRLLLYYFVVDWLITHIQDYAIHESIHRVLSSREYVVAKCELFNSLLFIYIIVIITVQLK